MTLRLQPLALLVVSSVLAIHLVTDGGLDPTYLFGVAVGFALGVPVGYALDRLVVRPSVLAYWRARRGAG